MNVKAVIFDMDGTLWDSSESVAAAWNKVLSDIDDIEITLTEDDVKSVMGLPMDVIAERLFGTGDPALDEEIMDRCGEYENTYLREHGGVLFEKLEDTLAALSENHRLFIVSNCQSGYIEAFLDHYGFEKYFEDYVCWGDNVLPKSENIALICERNDIAPENALYVGDTQGDCDSAYEAGVHFAFASYGFGTVDRFDIWLERISDLKALAESD